MKKMLVFAMLCLCIGAFAQESYAPSAGSLGLSARMAVLNDFLPGLDYDLFRNPGVGVGIRYHIADRLMLELILSGGYIIENNATSSDEDYITVGGGLFSDRNALDKVDSRSHIQILPPQVGIVFYF